MSVLSFLAAAVVARLKPEKTEIVHHRELERLNERILQLIAEKNDAQDQAVRWRTLARRWEQRYQLVTSHRDTGVNQTTQLAGASVAALSAERPIVGSPPPPPLHPQKLGAQTLDLDPAVWCNCVPARHDVFMPQERHANA